MVTSPVVVQKQIDGELKEVTIKKLHTLKCRAFLEEAAQWNPDGNFDRVSAMGMLMLYREDKMILFSGNPSKAQEQQNSGYAGNDPFFANNYDARFKKKTVNLGKITM